MAPPGATIPVVREHLLAIIAKAIAAQPDTDTRPKH
jgi:hypothetical protein